MLFRSLPSLLSPLLYPATAFQPHHLLSLFHSLRSLLSSHANLTIITSLPLPLSPRSSGLTRWLELLHDGVIELSPFPHSADALDNSVVRGPSGTAEEPPQGLLRLHRLPILHDRGSGRRAYDDDWTFTLSRRKLTIKPFNLPPIEGDQDAQQQGAAGGKDEKGNTKPKKADMEF